MPWHLTAVNAPSKVSNKPGINQSCSNRNPIVYRNTIGIYSLWDLNYDAMHDLFLHQNSDEFLCAQSNCFTFKCELGKSATLRDLVDVSGLLGP